MPAPATPAPTAFLEPLISILLPDSNAGTAAHVVLMSLDKADSAIDYRESLVCVNDESPIMLYELLQNDNGMTVLDVLDMMNALFAVGYYLIAEGNGDMSTVTLWKIVYLIEREM